MFDFDGEINIGFGVYVEFQKFNFYAKSSRINSLITVNLSVLGFFVNLYFTFEKIKLIFLE